MAPEPLARALARYALETGWDSLPGAVRAEAVRAFLNVTGCIMGGCREPAVQAALGAAALTGGGDAATLIGHGRRSDLATAAFVNCLSSAILAFDDTHLATVTHPSGPVAAAILAYAETTPVSGAAFLNALSLGMEITCRLSNALLLPPARGNTALYVTGLSGPIGAAAALGRLMGLDAPRLSAAMALAASMAAGFRATHGAMSGLMVPAVAARNAMHATLLAANGFTCMDDVLDSERGFLALFAPGADPAVALQGLGLRFEVLANAYKPYPAGIVVHAAIDACLEAMGAAAEGARVAAVRLTVPALSKALADRAHPADFFAAQISLQHWAAHACLRRSAGIAALRSEAIAAPDIVALRAKVEIVTDATFSRDEALAEIHLDGGPVLRAHVANARGSLARPMSDAELDAKFRAQAGTLLSGPAVEALLAQLRGLAVSEDVATALSPLLVTARQG
jgi:2-methylcitrate dehydratase PrpD